MLIYVNGQAVEKLSLNLQKMTRALTIGCVATAAVSPVRLSLYVNASINVPA